MYFCFIKDFFINRECPYVSGGSSDIEPKVDIVVVR